MEAAGESDLLATIPRAGDRIGDRYLVAKVLGQGAAGVVYSAVHDYTGRDVAIKWLHMHVATDVTSAQRFLREARAAASVRHPNVVEILDAGRDRGTFYLVMERLDGELLSAAFARKDLSVPAIARIFLTLMRGVSAAHDLGIVHRDLKPENVFLCPPTSGRPGGAKVLDFGISKLKRSTTSPDGELKSELTQAGVFIGSPYYMAPEQIADSRSVDARADIYAIGVMLYEALTHRVPFDAESLSALFAKVVSEKPIAIDDLRPDLPAALCDVVARAMHADPKARFSTLREMAEGLEPFAQGLRFDPGGDAFDVAWRERASMFGERVSSSDAPPARPSDPAGSGTRESDPAASAIDRARARASTDMLPEQPTVIRARDEATDRPTMEVPPPAGAVSPSMAPVPGMGGAMPAMATTEISATPTVMADPSSYAPRPAISAGAVPGADPARLGRPAPPAESRVGEPTQTFQHPPASAARPGSLVRALAPWIALAIVTAIVMLAAGIALGRLL